MSVQTKSESTADREILMSRLFDAPRELVWKAFTELKHISQWWGPNGFTTTTQKMEFKPGGAWRFAMHGPDGRNYENHISYLEIDTPQRLVYAHGGGDESEPSDFMVTVTFDDQNGKTLVTQRAIFPTAEARDFVVNEFGAIEGGKQHLQRLSDHLATLANDPEAQAGKVFVISRTFNAPRELVWKAWTERDHLMQWFGPRGFAITTATLDFRPGGFFHYCMKTSDGKEMWGKFIYREIHPQERIVWINTFSDAKGGLTRHPFAPEWPQQMLTKVILTEKDGKTIVTIRSLTLDASAAEKAVFDSNHDSITMGWGGTFDKLAVHLRRA